MSQTRLSKQLGTGAVFSLSLGPMLASGIFLLPALVYAQVGPAAIAAYAAAGLLLVPSLLSKTELSTAMPRAGGTYYFLDRSLGPVVGTVAGAGTWLALAFKSAFDLIGLGFYLVLFLNLDFRPVALALCVVFAGLSISGVKNVARIQIILVSTVVALLVFFIARSVPALNGAAFTPFFTAPAGAFLGAIGILFVGFTGITKVASVSEEVTDVERTLPRAMFAALGAATLLYVLGMIVLIGLIGGPALTASRTPIADAADALLGRTGLVVMSIVAIIAFVASANAGITAASRYPLAMGRDSLAPAVFARLGRFGTPVNAILVTAGLIILFILVLSPTGIAKLASGFQLMVFGLINLAVIVMRESEIASYDPGFRSPGYPWVQIVGIITSLILIPQLGLLPLVLTAGVIALSFLWYYLYAHERVQRRGALYHVFERIGRSASSHVDHELRQIMREKGLRRQDLFENSIQRATVLECGGEECFDDLLHHAARTFSERLDVSEGNIYAALNASNQLGETPIGNHIALPHARVEGIRTHELVIVHAARGLHIEGSDEEIYAIFVLVGPVDDPGQHLRFLAELANRSEGIDFAGEWRRIDDPVEIRELFVRSGAVREVTVTAPDIVGLTISEVRMHEECLIAFITRGERMVIPHGSTVLEAGDLVTLVGEEDVVADMADRFRA